METPILPKRIALEKLETVIGMLKVAAHPQRMAILDVLAREGEMSVSQLQDMLGMEQAIASQHLTLMKDKGLLGLKRQGKFSFYFLRHPDFVRIIDCVERCCNDI
ncbi:MAG: metalloregulator ArsR/SmtB family transcription factor [Chitinophagales bacterium]|nr:metalloregulator ArsR/SmtB family transcription factor [Chitinophagales bacterium]